MSRLHHAKTQALSAQLSRGGGPAGLAKHSSNLFRERAGGPRRRLDVSAFREVLEVDAAEGWVDAEGMVTYEDLVRGCLAKGVMPAVVPQLKTITLGGAMAGVGIEASSHRYGLVHDTALELEVLLGDGSLVLATPDNEHADLFHGFPNSYGTLGYALRVKAKAVPVKPYVRLEHLPFKDAGAFFASITRALVRLPWMTGSPNIWRSLAARQLRLVNQRQAFGAKATRGGRTNRGETSRDTARVCADPIASG